MTDFQPRLTANEWQTIRHALSVARGHYVEDAATMRAIVNKQPVAPEHERLAQQFDRQVADVDAILPKLDHL